MDLFIEILGWVGMVTYLVAYALISAKKTESDSFLYQGLNIFAGIALVIYTYIKGTYPTTVLNFFWACIGIVTLARKARIKNA